MPSRRQLRPGQRGLLDSLREHKGLRQTSALFVKNVLVAWRNRWATALRLLAPLMFLAMALMVQEVMNMNARRTGRTRDVPVTSPEGVASIPPCSSELFIYDKPCLDFVYTPNDSARIKEIVAAIQRHNTPPIPDSRVMGFSSRREADEFMQGRSKFVLGAVHFSESSSKQLQYIVQSNTSIPTFKGFVQSPNDFFQLPFMSAIAREISRSYLAAAGRPDDAAALGWAPRLAAFPHPQLSPGTAGYILPPFIFVACMFATISFLAVLVGEKESGLRQALQTMGLQQGSYWLSWWLFEAVMAAITAWCIIGFGAALQLSMFTANDVLLQFLLFWLFGLAMTSFACCASVFLETSQSAGNAGLAMILVGWVCQALAAIGMPYSPSIFFTKNGMGKAFFYIFALFPWSPLTKGVLDMSAASTNAAQRGLRFADRYSYCSYVPDPSRAASGADMSWLYLEHNCIFSIGQCYVVLVVQAVAWMMAAVYFDNVQPNRHGVRLPLWYPLAPSYWAGLFRSLLAALSGVARVRDAGRASAGGRPSGGGTIAHRSGTTHRSPFAAPDAARKVAKSMSDAKGGEQLVIRCSSTSAGGALEAISSRPLPSGLPTAPTHATSVASVARHSVSSGFLRRRDNRHSGSGVPDAGGGGSNPGDLPPASSRGGAGGAGGSTVGRLPHFPPLQHSAQLIVQSSVTVLRLSDSSSDATSLPMPPGYAGALAAGTAVGAGAAGLSQAAAGAPGTSLTLAQYQAVQAARRSGGAAARRWWEFWRTGEDSLTLASRKHGSMVAAAAAGAPGATALQHSGKELVGTFGVTPVVLDPGVLQEEQRLKAALFADAAGTWTPKQDLVQVFGLRKVYTLPGSGWWRSWRWQAWRRRRRVQRPGAAADAPPRQYVAVVDSWFGVPKGQLLCLLGPNGAGKTTTINCLIGALPPSGGDVRVMGHSLLAPDGLELAQGVMGVCPQFDVLWDELSGREHMYIYGCIKGLPSADVVEQGARLLEQVQLTPAANKRSSSYSGGMKRRLSVALALLGSPQLVFLDEPSTGMDPISRRAVWDAINAAKQQAAVVLTTHSMEEADALGDRIGIMVRGRLRVLGGSLTLKQKYGSGYQLRLRLSDAQAACKQMQAAVQEQLRRLTSEQQEQEQAQEQALALRPPLQQRLGQQQQALQPQQQQQLHQQLALGRVPPLPQPPSPRQQQQPQQQQQQQQQQQVALPQHPLLSTESSYVSGGATPRELISFFERISWDSCSSSSVGGPRTGVSPAVLLRHSSGSDSHLSACVTGTAPGGLSPVPSLGGAPGAQSGGGALQQLVANRLGLAPMEEGRRMLHYVIPQELAPQLQGLLELLDSPEQQRRLGLAEVHVSLATLEEVFLAVVKQAEQDYAALHGQTVVVELPSTGQQLEVPVGQEVAVDPTSGEVFAVDWVQDEWGKLAVTGVRQMEPAEQQRYWQNRHLVQ